MEYQAHQQHVEPQSLSILTQLRRHASGWAILSAGVLLGAAVVVWTGLRPAARELSAVQTRLAVIDGALERLVREERVAGQSASLMGALVEQGQRAQEAEQGLARIQALGEKLTAQAAAVEDALGRSLALQQQVAAHGNQAISAGEAMERIDRVNNELIEQGNRAVEAKRALDSLAAVRASAAALQEDACDIDLALQDMANLHARVISQHEAAAGIEHALSEFARLAWLASDVVPGVESARESLVSLTELKSLALAQADAFASLKERLLNEAPDTADANLRLDSLVSLQNRLVAETGDLAAAVETLELSTDLRRQLERVMQSFDRLRHWMAEVVLMEPALTRTIQTLQPLMEMGNLRHLSSDELRRAARHVVEQRLDRVAGATAPASEAAAVQSAANPGGTLGLDEAGSH